MQGLKNRIFGSKIVFKSVFAGCFVLVFFIFPVRGFAAPSPAPSGKPVAPIFKPHSSIADFPASPGRPASPVFAKPQSIVAVKEKTSIVNAGIIRTSEFSVTVVFTVEGDYEKVSMYLEASDLYKDGDAMDPNKASPIALSMSKPAEIVAQPGPGSDTKKKAGLQKAIWHRAGNPISGFNSKRTEIVIYESARRGRSSQDISCKIWFTQPGAVTAAGQYSGKVKLTATIIP